MPDSKASLLDQLHVDRRVELRRGSSRGGITWIVVATLLIVAAAGARLMMTRSSAIPVRVATAKPTATAPRGASTLDGSGYIVARRQATVSAKITGRVVAVFIEEGQQVAKGFLIARLDDSNVRGVLEQAVAQIDHLEASLHAAQVAADDARPIYQRNVRQREAGLISAQDLDVATATYNTTVSNLEVAKRAAAVARASLVIAQQNEDDTLIRAPFAGVVTVKAAQAGEIVSPVSAGGGFTRTGIGTIVDMNSLELDVDVSEQFISRVQAGQPATVTLNAYPESAIAAVVIAVVPTADRAKATVKVRIGFLAKDPRILPEMGARVSFLDATPAATDRETTKVAPAVIVPTDAVQGSGDHAVVFVLNGDVVRRSPVRLGARVDDGQVILSGLTEGARVVVGGLDGLTDGAKVKPAP